MRIDFEVYRRFMNRWTSEEYARLQEIERGHDLRSCAFVDAVRGRAEAGALETAARAALGTPVDVAAMVGVRVRFSAAFADPLGAQSVARGENWASVAGVIEQSR